MADMMNTNSYLLYAIIAMAVVTFITRALPALIPQRLLNTPWLHRLNERLPLAVLVLLILTSLSYQGLFTGFKLTAEAGQVAMLTAQIGALIIVLAIYHWSRQLLVSMIAGIAALNAILWLLM
ncbi:AzlD domain-containing protein [Psychrobacter arenosus]|uniref:AzlD domain-containing protein n=1 Tax=Psychrobacter arenosus TaxID=256326 RepID=UPI001D110B92|nr:AzlD domain-containing protein [Psychrobacter arenosus]